MGVLENQLTVYAFVNTIYVVSTVLSATYCFNHYSSYCVSLAEERKSERIYMIYPFSNLPV